MESAIRDVVVPALRAAGFKGSFPHFRRQTATKIELLTFQFHSAGGSFVVEIAEAPPDGHTHSWGKFVPPNKVTAWDVHPRHRLGAEADGDFWFVFGKRSFEAVANDVFPATHYRVIAEHVLARFSAEAPTFWAKT